MGQLENKKKVKIQYNNQKINELELNANSKLDTIRKKLIKSIDFPFIFLDDNDNEITKEEEASCKLNDILEGRYLYIKKKIKTRKIVGEKIDSNNGLDFYLYPKANLTDIQKTNSFNIMIIGETGVGKSTWIHSLLNYLEEIEFDENIRYLLFDEKQKQKEYEMKYGKKTLGSSITDIPEIYEIAPTKLFDNPIQIIDTTGFGDTRGIEYDNKNMKDIQNLFENSKIGKIHAICLVFKATETRAHDRFKYIIDKIFSLFGDDVKNNFIIIFTFFDFYSENSIIKVLKDENSSLCKILGDINNLPIFSFNNKAYFEKNRNLYYDIYEKNIKNYQDFFFYLSYIQPIELEKTKKILKARVQIREQINTFYVDTNRIIKEINTLKNINKNKSDKKRSIIEYYNSTYSLYCQNHERMCHRNCNGELLCPHFNKQISKNCNVCSCSESSHRYIMNYENKKEEEYNSIFLNEIDINNDKYIKYYNGIYHYLISYIENFHKIVLQNKEINEISLKKEDGNNKGNYIINAFNEVITKKNIITDFVKDNLFVIESLNENERINLVHNFIDICINNKDI